MDTSTSISTTADQPSISLRAWPTNDPTKDALSVIISRINSERGSFRNITEDELEEEIRTLKGSKADLEDQPIISQANGTQNAKLKREEVFAVREEILKHVDCAWNESATALDLISAVLSKHTPRQAELTMSPFLKQSLPMGSFGTEVVQTPQKSEKEKHQDELVTSGWKLQSLSSTADALLASASRLEEEIKRETTYWGQVLAVKEHGWSMHRLPREKHTLGVRYGFAEAHPDFRDRGLAALRRDEDGNISLDLGNKSTVDRALRVRILQKGLPIASHVRVFEQGMKQMPVVKLLLKARDSIYDEELHHELHREARNYINQGIRSIDSKIIIPYELGKEIEIDLVSSMDEESPISDNDICKTIALSLRILLSSAHHQNLPQRSQIPPPIREGKSPRPMHAILRPILETLQHRLQIQKARIFLDHVTKNLSKAKLALNINETKSEYYFINKSSIINHENLSATDKLVRALTAPLESSIIAFLPSQLTTIKIEIQTGLQPPLFGTDYRCTIMNSASESLIARMPASIRFPSLDALEAHVLHLIELDLVSLLIPDQNIRKAWKSTSLHACRLSRKMEESGTSQKLTISVRRNQLQLNWRRHGSGIEAEGTETWDDTIMKAKGLMETIHEVFADVSKT